MPELRQNFFTKEWVIIATERAKRPEELVDSSPSAAGSVRFWKPAHSVPGNEDKTPPEVLRSPVRGRSLAGARHSQ